MKNENRNGLIKNDDNNTCPQAQTNITIAEAEAADENAKHWLRMQNTKRAGGISSDYCIMFLFYNFLVYLVGISCGEKKTFFLEYLDPTSVCPV